MAGVWLLPIIFTVIFLVATIISLIVMARLNQAIQKIDINPNSQIIDATARRQFTNGYTDGIIKKMHPKKNGTYYIEFYPIDSEQGENKPKPDLQRLIVAKEMIKVIPKGEGSTRREKILILPRTPEDLPESMRDTSKGEWMTKEGQLGHILKVFGKAIPAGDEAISSAMSHYARGNIAQNIVNQMAEEQAQFRKMNQLKRNDQVEEKK